MSCEESDFKARDRPCYGSAVALEASIADARR